MCPWATKQTLLLITFSNSFVLLLNFYYFLPITFVFLGLGTKHQSSFLSIAQVLLALPPYNNHPSRLISHFLVLSRRCNRLIWLIHFLLVFITSSRFLSTIDKGWTFLIPKGGFFHVQFLFSGWTFSFLTLSSCSTCSVVTSLGECKSTIADSLV